ncbi:MAG: glycosyl hydrolase family 18 protein [Candidatus Daviesbacteria bacterium]|nr:glycosyl hydrolase family 18 protein [Candidatus Daviesbacteria bacterium]
MNLPFPKVQQTDSPIPISFQGPNGEEQENKISFLKKIVEVEVGINIVIGAVIIFLVVLILAWKNEAKIQSKAGTGNSDQVRVVEPASLVEQRVVIAKEGFQPPIYINEQTVDIERAFSAPSDGITLTVHGPLKKEVMGFLPYWVLDKIEDIDIKVLSSVSFFGLEVDGAGNIIKTDAEGKVTTPWFYFQNGPRFEKFIQKAKNDRIKVYLTLKCFNQDNIVKLVTSPEARSKFIENALYLMNSKSLDGINLDFEYIGTPSKNVIDGFSLLVIDLNKEMKRQYPQAQLTIDTFIDAASNARIHDIPVLAQHADSLIIMGYDFSTPNSQQAGPVAPMEGGYSIFNFMSAYLEKAPAEKLILAVPYYGYDWPVTSASKNGVVLGSTADVRIRTYAEIAGATANSQINWDENSQTPWFSYSDSGQTRVAHFENTRSLGIKYDFVNDKALGGVAIWALGFDGLRNDLAQLLSDKFSGSSATPVASE